MKNRKHLQRILLLAAACLIAMAQSGCKEQKEDFPSRIAGEVRSANKLVLAQMAISKMASIDDLKLDDARGMKQKSSALLDAFKIGARKGAYSYDTYMRAYVDLSTLAPEDVKVNEEAKTIELSLPPIQTEFAGRDAELREDHYRVTGLRSAINAEERAAVKEAMSEALKAEVENDPEFRDMLVDAARRKGISYFENLCGRYGYTAAVKFK